MSANDTNPDKPAETPPAVVQKPAASKSPAAPRQVSRLYARMRRDKAGTPPPASASLSGEPVTQIDNLPVRATAPSHLVGEGEPSRDDRSVRPERSGRFDRSERRHRGDRGGRGGSGERRERSGRDDRGPGPRRPEDRRERDERPPETSWEAPAEESAAPAEFEPAERVYRPDEPDQTNEYEDQEEGPDEDETSPPRRGPRFEAADDVDSDRSHLIQEFKPSRHSESPRGGTPTHVPAGKKGSLMGWIKSVFTGGGETTETPDSSRPSSPSGDRRSRDSERGRGDRGRGQGGRGSGQGPSSGGTDADGRPRRRRRRRSGPGGGGGGPGGGGGSGGGSGGGRGRGGNRRPPRAN